MLDTIQELYESSEISDNDKSKLFEIFNSLIAIRNVINTYITKVTMNDYEPLAIDSYNNKINDKINNIQNILTQLTEQTKQIAKKLNDLSNEL